MGHRYPIPQVCCWTVVCWLPTLEGQGFKVMHTNNLKSVCAAASTNSLRILRALNLLGVPQRPEELAEGLELDIFTVNYEISRLEAAGIVQNNRSGLELAVDLRMLFCQPLMPTEPTKTSRTRRIRKGTRV